MSEAWSRVLLALEAVIICLPLTVLFVVFIVPSTVYFATESGDPLSLSSAIAIAVILATWACAWWLIGLFLARGTTALRSTALFWWILPFGTAALGFLAVLHVLLATVLEPSAFNIFAWGLPCIVPLAHLSWERWLRA